MTDFMKWLYTAYIKPQIDRAPVGEYEMFLSLMENELRPDQKETWNRIREFDSIHAFLLGMRTGAGLEHLR